MAKLGRYGSQTRSNPFVNVDEYLNANTGASEGMSKNIQNKFGNDVSSAKGEASTEASNFSSSVPQATTYDESKVTTLPTDNKSFDNWSNYIKSGYGQSFTEPSLNTITPYGGATTKTAFEMLGTNPTTTNVLNAYNYGYNPNASKANTSLDALLLKNSQPSGSNWDTWAKDTSKQYSDVLSGRNTAREQALSDIATAKNTIPTEQAKFANQLRTMQSNLESGGVTQDELAYLDAILQSQGQDKYTGSLVTDIPDVVVNDPTPTPTDQSTTTGLIYQPSMTSSMTPGKVEIDLAPADLAATKQAAIDKQRQYIRQKSNRR